LIYMKKIDIIFTKYYADLILGYINAENT